MTDPWTDLARQMAEALTEEPAGGAVTEAEVDTQVGATEFDFVVESSDGDAENQGVAYAVLCDLLATRLEQGAGQVMGCLLIDGDPDPEAFASGLAGMRREHDVFTPVLPLSREQAKELLAKDQTLFDTLDPATALIDIAASRDPITGGVAETVLSEIDELISR